MKMSVFKRSAVVLIDIPLTKEFKIDIARFDIPVSGWTCFKTESEMSVNIFEMENETRLEDD
jgi:hypothetical protein